MAFHDLFSVNTTTRLSPDMNSWGEQITANLLNKFPAFSKLVGDIVFAKVDKVKGNVVGYILLTDRAQRIPFIVDEYELNPLDIYIDNGSYLPLNEHAIDRIVNRVWPFRVISQQERSSITKTASLFEDTGVLKDSFIAQHKAELEKIAEAFPEILEKYASRNLITPENEEFAVRCFVKTASEQNPLVVRDLLGEDKEYSMTKFAEAFGQDFLKEVMRNGEVIISNKGATAQLEIDRNEIRKTFKTNKRAGFLDVKGDLVYAQVFDHKDIASLKQSEGTPKIVITKDGYFNTGSTFNLFEKPGQTGDIAFRNSGITMGMNAGFVYGDSIIGPFTVKSIVREGQVIRWTVLSNELKDINFKFVEDIKGIVPVDSQNYLVSNKLPVIEMKPIKAYKSEEKMLKTASLNVTVNKTLDGKIAINDAGVSGIQAGKLQRMGKGDAIVALMHSGLSENDARYALTKAMEAGSYSFPATTKMENAEIPDAKLIKKAEEITNSCNKNELLKVAVITGDASNIDMALGLNLITHKNVLRFKLLVPELYQMMDKICKLLICKRMNRNLLKVDETQLAQAVQTLDDIAVSLGSL